MCEVCRMDPCNSRCPNAEEPKKIYECKCCNNGIFQGDRYFDLGGEYICEACMLDMTLEEFLNVVGETMKTCE